MHGQQDIKFQFVTSICDWNDRESS